MTNIYVGNISYKASESDLENLFSEFAEVSEVKIITDRETGRSKGFGFVTMEDEKAAAASIEELNGISFMDRDIVVNEARPRQDRRNNRRGGGGGGGYNKRY